jgi:large subunit ribosomal protein L10
LRQVIESEEKKKVIEEIINEAKNSKSIAVVGIGGVPAKQFQSIRKSLRGKAKIKVAKKTLIKKALDQSNLPSIEGLEEHSEGPIAIIFSNESSFKLYKEIQNSRMRAPARGGEIAQEDILVPAKATNLKPGPVVGELQKAGIPAAIDQGKVVIKKDTLLVKKGEKISREKALALAKLEILPLEIGLDFRAAWEDGIVFHKDVLAVPPEQQIAQMREAYTRALALAVAIEYPTKESIPLLLSKAYNNAKALSIAIEFPTKENIKELLALGKAQAEAISKIVEEKKE